MTLSRQMKAFLGWIGSGSLLMGIYLGAQKLNQYAQTLPVDTAPVPSRELDAQKSSALANLYPLIATPDGKAREKSVRRSLDTAFMPPPPPKPKVPPPDYVALMMQGLTVDAVTESGAVINQKFYEIGEPMRDLATADMVYGGVSVPVIRSIAGDTVTLVAGTRTFQLRFVEQ